MAKFKMTPVVPVDECFTARLGLLSGTSNILAMVDIGKAHKLGTDSQYVPCVAGDPIEAFLVGVESAPLDGYNIGTLCDEGRKYVICDGLQATAGTGTIAVGDYVVMGTAYTTGVAMGAAYNKVCKATNQPGATVTSADNTVGNINAAIAKVVDAQNVSKFAWRVVSLGNAGAVGDTAVIERVND